MEDDKCPTTSNSKTTNIPNMNAEDNNIPKENDNNGFIEASSSSASSVLKTDPIDDEKTVENNEDKEIKDEMVFNMSPEDIQALKEKHPSLTPEEILEAVEYYQEPENSIPACTIEEIELAEAFLKQTVRDARELIDIYHNKATLIFVLNDMADYKDMEEGPPGLEYEFGDSVFLRKIADSMQAMIVEDDYYALTKALYECLVQEARERLKNVDELLEKCANEVAYPEEEFYNPPPFLERGVAAG